MPSIMSAPRGRGAGTNKPAWMTKQEHESHLRGSEDVRGGNDRSRSRSRDNGKTSGSRRSRDRDDSERRRRDRSSSLERDQFGRVRDGSRDGYEDRQRDRPEKEEYHRGGRDDDYDDRRAVSRREERNDDRRPDRRERKDDRPRRGRGSSSANRSGIFFHSYEEERDWLDHRRRKRMSRKSLFDLEPTPEQLAVDEARAALEARVGLGVTTIFGGTTSSSSSVQPQQTRHARRLYIGNIPDISEDQVHDFFRDAIRTAIILDPSSDSYSSHKHQYVDNDPIISVYINRERRFSFLEFKTMEITTACLELDGIDVLGRGKVKIKRPNDYNPALAPFQPADSLPKFDTSKLGIISMTVQDGPNKIFIGGLPYHLTESQVLELLSAFGTVKAFHLVKNDPTAVTSKGYCFVEFVDPNATQIAAIGLNGMDMGGGKVLSAKLASQSSENLDQSSQTNVVDGVDVDALLQAAMGGGGVGMASLPNFMTNSLPAGESMGSMITQHPYQQIPLSCGTGTLNQQYIASPTNSMLQQGLIPHQQVVVTDPLAVANAAASALDAAFGASNSSTTMFVMRSQQAQTTIGRQDVTRTRILVLLNMVMDEDLATEENRKFLEEEVREEAGKYGKLLSMKIPRVEDNFAPSAVKKIFLEYATTSDAFNAEKELKGRAFGPNIVDISYFSEEDYANHHLS